MALLKKAPSKNPPLQQFNLSQDNKLALISPSRDLKGGFNIESETRILANISKPAENIDWNLIFDHAVYDIVAAPEQQQPPKSSDENNTNDFNSLIFSEDDEDDCEDEEKQLIEQTREASVSVFHDAPLKIQVDSFYSNDNKQYKYETPKSQSKQSFCYTPDPNNISKLNLFRNIYDDPPCRIMSNTDTPVKPTIDTKSPLLPQNFYSKTNFNIRINELVSFIRDDKYYQQKVVYPANTSKNEEYPLAKNFSSLKALNFDCELKIPKSEPLEIKHLAERNSAKKIRKRIIEHSEDEEDTWKSKIAKIDKEFDRKTQKRDKVLAEPSIYNFRTRLKPVNYKFEEDSGSGSEKMEF